MGWMAQNLADGIRRLDPSEQMALFHELGSWMERMRRRARGGTEVLDELRERRFSSGAACPRCGSVDVQRWGRRNGRQRYRCKDCVRTFNDLTGTPFAHSRRPWDLWLAYAELMLKGTSIRDCAKELGISIGTSFRWRHAILRGLQIGGPRCAEEHGGEAGDRDGPEIVMDKGSRLHASLKYLPPAEYWQGDPEARIEERKEKLERARKHRETVNRARLQEAA